MTQIYYAYRPYRAAAMVATAFFAVSTLLHVFQMIRRRTWFMTAFIVGGLFSTFGYAVRFYSVQHRDKKSVFVIQLVLILLAPTLYTASLYMILGRIITSVKAPQYSIVPIRWLTKVFVISDIFSFFVQAIGGATLAAASTKTKIDLGQHIALAGIILQMVSFALFFLTAVIFQIRISKGPTSMSRQNKHWKRVLYMLYGASVLIYIRCIYRLVSFVSSPDSKVKTDEAIFYVLDTMMMVLMSYLLNVIHPNDINKVNNSEMEEHRLQGV